MMKRVITTAVVLAGVVATAGSAMAQSPADCDLIARQEMERQYPTGGGALTGGLIGAIGGAVISGATGGSPGTGAAIGGGAGLVVGSARWQQLRQQVYNTTNANCLTAAQQVSAPPPAPPVLPPPPTPYFARTTASAQNVRTHPTTQGSTVLFTVNPSQVFQMLVCGNPVPGWCFMDLNGAQGYISQSLTVPVS